MKTDRELLELAAKAARIFGVWHERGQCIHVTGCDGMSDVWWRPHADDGDALRLAASLRIDIEFFASTVYAGPRYTGKYAVGVTDVFDPYSATRLAILDAAAAIGEQMK